MNDLDARVGDRAHDAGHDARRPAHAGADDRELRAVRAHPQRQVEVAQFARARVSTFSSSHTKNTPASLTLIMSIEMSAPREAVEELAVERRRASPSSLSLEMTRKNATSRSAVMPVTGRSRSIGVAFVDQRPDVGAQALHRVRRVGRVRELGGFGVHDLGAVPGELDHLGRLTRSTACAPATRRGSAVITPLTSV